MKIDALLVQVRKLPRRDPTWRTASYASSEVTGVYVGVRVGDVTGVGATAAHPRTMPPDVLVEAITDRIRPAIEGVDLDRAWATLAELDGVPSRARLGADLAVHDLLGRLAGVGSEVLWGGPVRDRITVIRMVGIKDPDELCATIAPLYEQGLRGFKLKIGRGIGPDVAAVRRVREQFGADVTLTVDANAAYDLDTARTLSEELAELKVGCIEQPLPYTDIDAMAALRSSSPVPLMADQLVQTAADAVRVANAGAADMVSLKLTKTGSVAEAVRVLDVCAATGLRVHIGGSGAPGIVDSALTRLALAHSGVEAMAEVGESMALVEEHRAGVRYEGPWAMSDGRPGLGGTDLDFDSAATVR